MSGHSNASNGSQKSVMCLLKGVKKERQEVTEEQGQGLLEANGQRLSQDKGRYNKFNYKMRLSDESIKQQWAVIRSQELSAPELFNQFVESVISSQVGGSEKGKKRRIMKDEDETEKLGQWMSYKQAADLEGTEVLNACIKSGSIASRAHPDLPTEHGIAWPHFLQVQHGCVRDGCYSFIYIYIYINEQVAPLPRLYFSSTCFA